MIHHGDLFDVLPTLQAQSIDACVTDPPYGISFMGKHWDNFRRADNAADAGRDSVMGRLSRSAPASGAETDRLRFEEWTQDWACEVLRVLKPGAHALVFGATRNAHRMTCGLEDAGFEIRDTLAWLYGSGFPKSLNLGEGRGTALKPAYEPIVLCRKPCEGSTTKNAHTYGTGGLRVDVCRINPGMPVSGGGNGQAHNGGRFGSGETSGSRPIVEPHDLGRWPSNVLLDEDAAAMLDEQSGELTSGDWTELNRNSDKFRNTYAAFKGGRVEHGRPSDSGGASRFFYVAKPSRAERDQGCEFVEARQRDESRIDGNPGGDNPRNRGVQLRANHHPTVKPVELMRYLVRLVTPRDGAVLDPFAGSGTTGMACAYEGLRFIGIEREAEYVDIARRRIHSVAPLFSGELGA